MLRETKNYYMWPKTVTTTLINLIIALCLIGLAWMFFDTPRQFRGGIYPKIQEIFIYQQDLEKIIKTQSERLEFLEDVLENERKLNSFSSSRH